MSCNSIVKINLSLNFLIAADESMDKAETHYDAVKNNDAVDEEEE